MPISIDPGVDMPPPGVPTPAAAPAIASWISRSDSLATSLCWGRP